jgi:hypothetical protein
VKYFTSGQNGTPSVIEDFNAFGPTFRDGVFEGGSKV